MKNSQIKSILIGSTATLMLLFFYFLTMRLLAGSFKAAIEQFKNLWYYMLPLSIGFGIQVGLYTRIKQLMNATGVKGIMAGNTTTSTIGMIACCAHHLNDVLPIIGLSLISTFLANYQIPILIIGIASNLLGIIYLLRLHSKISK